MQCARCSGVLDNAIIPRAHSTLSEDVMCLNVEGTNHGHERIQPHVDQFSSAGIAVVQIPGKGPTRCPGCREGGQCRGTQCDSSDGNGRERAERSTTCAGRVRSASSSAHSLRSATTHALSCTTYVTSLLATMSATIPQTCVKRSQPASGTTSPTVPQLKNCCQ